MPWKLGFLIYSLLLSSSHRSSIPAYSKNRGHGATSLSLATPSTTHRNSKIDCKTAPRQLHPLLRRIISLLHPPIHFFTKQVSSPLIVPRNSPRNKTTQASYLYPSRKSTLSASLFPSSSLIHRLFGFLSVLFLQKLDTILFPQPFSHPYSHNHTNILGLSSTILILVQHRSATLSFNTSSPHLQLSLDNLKQHLLRHHPNSQLPRTTFPASKTAYLAASYLPFSVFP